LRQIRAVGDRRPLDVFQQHVLAVPLLHDVPGVEQPFVRLDLHLRAVRVRDADVVDELHVDALCIPLADDVPPRRLFPLDRLEWNLR
jgi:hypothetical protein